MAIIIIKLIAIGKVEIVRAKSGPKRAIGPRRKSPRMCDVSRKTMRTCLDTFSDTGIPFSCAEPEQTRPDPLTLISWWNFVHAFFNYYFFLFWEICVTYFGYIVLVLVVPAIGMLEPAVLLRERRLPKGRLGRSLFWPSVKYNFSINNQTFWTNLKKSKSNKLKEN